MGSFTHSVLNVMSVAFLFLSCWFLLKGDLGLSPRTIAKLTSRFSRDQTLVSELCRQKANTKVGFALLLVAIAADFRLMFTTFLIENMGPPSGLAFVVGGVFTVIAWFVAALWSSRIASACENEVLHQRTWWLDQ